MDSLGHLRRAIASGEQRRRVLAYTGGRRATIHCDSLRALFASPARLVICPLQDILGLGRRARMNTPGTTRGNWAWRLDSPLPAAAAEALRLPTAMFERNACPQSRDPKPASPH